MGGGEYQGGEKENKEWEGKRQDVRETDIPIREPNVNLYAFPPDDRYWS